MWTGRFQHLHSSRDTKQEDTQQIFSKKLKFDSWKLLVQLAGQLVEHYFWQLYWLSNIFPLYLTSFWRRSGQWTLLSSVPVSEDLATCEWVTFLCQNWLFSNRKFCSFILRLLKTFWYGRFSFSFLFKVAISIVTFSNLWFSDSFASKYCHWNGRKVCWFQTEIFWRKKILLLQSCKILCTYIPTFFLALATFFA